MSGRGGASAPVTRPPSRGAAALRVAGSLSARPRSPAGTTPPPAAPTSPSAAATAPAGATLPRRRHLSPRRRHLSPGRRHRPRPPQRRSPRQPETTECPGRRQRLGLGRGDPGPAHHVLHVPIRPPRGDPRRQRRRPPPARTRAPAAPRRPPAEDGPGSSTDAARLALTSGPSTVTPCRRASATMVWGDQNPMGWPSSSPAQNAAG